MSIRRGKKVAETSPTCKSMWFFKLIADKSRLIVNSHKVLQLNSSFTSNTAQPSTIKLPLHVMNLKTVPTCMSLRFWTQRESPAYNRDRNPLVNKQEFTSRHVCSRWR